VKKLLLAEDNLFNQKIATELLSDYGFEVKLQTTAPRQSG
jgi:CheY-like chemotaxis protein